MTMAYGMSNVAILYLEIYLFYIEIFMVLKYIYGLKYNICSISKCLWSGLKINLLCKKKGL